MKRLYSILILSLFVLPLLADNVSVERAQDIAQQFYSALAPNTRSISSQWEMVWNGETSHVLLLTRKVLAQYFPSTILQYVVKQPLNKLEAAEKYDIKVNLYGGGFTGQSQALRLAIARAVV